MKILNNHNPPIKTETENVSNVNVINAKPGVLTDYGGV